MYIENIRTFAYHTLSSSSALHSLLVSLLFTFFTCYTISMIFLSHLCALPLFSAPRSPIHSARSILLQAPPHIGALLNAPPHFSVFANASALLDSFDAPRIPNPNSHAARRSSTFLCSPRRLSALLNAPRQSSELSHTPRNAISLSRAFHALRARMPTPNSPPAIFLPCTIPFCNWERKPVLLNRRIGSLPQLLLCRALP